MYGKYHMRGCDERPIQHKVKPNVVFDPLSAVFLYTQAYAVLYVLNFKALAWVKVKHINSMQH